MHLADARHPLVVCPNPDFFEHFKAYVLNALESGPTSPMIPRVWDHTRSLDVQIDESSIVILCIYAPEGELDQAHFTALNEIEGTTVPRVFIAECDNSYNVFGALVGSDMSSVTLVRMAAFLFPPGSKKVVGDGCFPNGRVLNFRDGIAAAGGQIAGELAALFERMARGQT